MTMKRSSKITDLLALVVFAVFAVCVLVVLLTGAKVYQNLVRSGGESYAARTAVQYIATRVRQAENVCVEDFDGCDALVLREEIDGECYVTRVYCHEGHIRELFSPEDAALSPEDGEPVLEAESLSFSLEDGLLTVQTDSRRLVLYLPTEKEAGP